MKKNKIKASAAFCLAAALTLSSCENMMGETTSGESHVHKVLHWEVVREVDCENSGMRFGTCIDCMNEVRDEQEPLGHDYRGGEACVRCGAESNGDGEKEEVQLEYELAPGGNGYILKSAANVTSRRLVIPAEYNGKPVIAIGERILISGSHAASIETVVIPDSVIEIREGAFESCSSLREVKMSKNLVTLERNAFLGCTKLREIVLPDTLKSIGYGCFTSCTSLERVVANGCTYIGESAFLGCERLYFFNLSKNANYIGREAFFGSSVSDIVIPDSVTHIGDYAFGGTPIKTARIPAGVVSSYRSAFNNCNLLESAVVETDNIRNEFENCKKLKTLTFAEGVRYIGEYAVGTCEVLETVYLPKSLELIDETFMGSYSLKKIVYAGTSAEWLALNRSLYWFILPEGCVVECSDVTLTREELRALETTAENAE